MPPEKAKAPAAGDAPAAAAKKDVSKIGSKKQPEPPEPEEPPKTPSQIAQEEAEYRAMLRRTRFKRRWPEITKPKIRLQKWSPPPPPQRPPKIELELPELTTRRWVPPYRRRRRPRPPRPRIAPEDMTQPLYEYNALRKIWHNFHQVDRNKMLLQGSISCNSKRYSSTACGSQTGCIAVVARALLDVKEPSQLVRQDVDDIIDAGDKYYRQCMLAMKCYKGKPQLALNQLLTSFFLHDTKFTVKMNEMERGLLAKHPDNIQNEPDLMSLMEKRVGSTFTFILTVGNRHFLVWGHPPSAEHGSQVKTVCYLFDPHMMDEFGVPYKLPVSGACCRPTVAAGGFVRYAGISSFVTDFLANYGDLDSAKKGTPKPAIALTNIDVVQKESLIREPNYELDMKALKIHCKSEWESLNYNKLIEMKQNQGQYPLASLSAVSLATSRASTRRKVQDFYQKTPKEPLPSLPVAPEKPPAAPTQDQIMQLRGEDFFLYCPATDIHSYGRDDLAMVPVPKSETILHSPVVVAEQNYHSQYSQLDVGKWILRATRHMASMRYSKFKTYTAIACCVAALGTLQRLRARAWNEDTLDETLDIGYNLFLDSLSERGGPIRRLVLGELKDKFHIRDKELHHKSRGIAVWGKLLSSSPTVLDLCRGIESFFKESDAGVLQIPGEYETAIFHEGDKYYVYHPWPADKYGYRVGLQDGGKACLLSFGRITRLCEHFMESVSDMKRKPFSIADVYVTEKKEMPEPKAEFQSVAPNRWVVRGSYHEADSRFPEEHRGKQATPTAIVAIAMSHLLEPEGWTKEEVDETLVRGDILYQNTIEHLEKMGISLDAPKGEEDEGGEEEQELSPTGTLAAADVLNRFKVSEYDCIESDVMDSQYIGSLRGDQANGVISLKDSLKTMFKEHSHAVLTARGASLAIWRHEDDFYMFDPHGCDDNGYPSDEPHSAACLVRVKGSIDELADVIESNLPAGTDDSFNLSPVAISASKLNAELGAPETKLENKSFQWIAKGTAAVLMGPRGENSALGKAAKKAAVPHDDFAGRTIALPAAAAFTAAAESVPPPHMHQDHMYNFLDAGADYYNNFYKKTGRKDIQPEDLTEKFEMGANTFSIELGEPIRLPLRLPDKPGEGEGEEENAEIGGEGEEEEKEKPMKQIKEALFKMWYDGSKSSHLALLVGDYHQLGVWMATGGKVVAFDPAPTQGKAMLTVHRIKEGDQLRLQRIKDEMAGEGGDEEAEDEEVGAEGEQLPEPEPEFVPPDSCPALMVFASPGEFIDRLVLQGHLDNKQSIAPYKLYPVTVKNELTSLLKEKKAVEKKPEDEAAADEEEEEVLVEPVTDEAMGKYFTRVSRGIGSVRGQIAQNEAYFMESPNRDNQDAAMAIMSIAVDHIEPYVHWKPQLIDAIMKYGDRLYTMSLSGASNPPKVKPSEVVREFHVTNFNVRTEVEADTVTGDLKAGNSGALLNLKRGLMKFFESNKYGVLCAKDHCVAVFLSPDEKCYCLFAPHAVGPSGRSSPGGAAGLTVFSSLDDLADTYKANVDGLARPGANKFSISAVKVFWEFSKSPAPLSAQGTVPDEGYEWKVLTAFVEMAKGRTILRGTRPPDIVKFHRESILQSACGAIVGSCMSHVRRPHLWTRRTVDEVMAVAGRLFALSVGSLGYEFRPGDDVLLPLQVVKRFILGVNYVRYELESAFTGRLEQIHPAEMSVRCALERFFESHTHGILWCVPHAVAVWRCAGAPAFYMMEPHACGPTGLRIDAQDDGAPCLLTFTSAKLMAFAYLQNVPVVERPKHEFRLYAMSVSVQPIRPLGGVEPPLVKGGTVPATSKVDLRGKRRRADERDRKHPPGDTTCLDAVRASEKRDADVNMKGQRNTSGWLVMPDGTQFLSASHSMACKAFPYASRGYQAVPCCVMGVAMSRVEEVCRWCGATLDAVLAGGEQLYQDSLLHYKPKGRILKIEQVLRKFYTPGNCVCRVLIFQPRQTGNVDENLLEKVTQFFKEEKAGVFVAGRGEFAVALFRTARGFYMWDPADRDRYARAVAPPCRGRGRACFSQYNTVQALVDKLGPNIPPEITEPEDTKEVKVISGEGADKSSVEDKGVRFESPPSFAIYGMDVTSLRRLNKHER